MAIPKNMRNYYLGLLLKGERWSAEESPEHDRLQQEHLAYIRSTLEQGKNLLAGPVRDESRFQGASVIAAASQAEAEAVMAGDPGVQAGFYTFEVHPVFWPALDCVKVEF
jgi:uncharacterized protein YciI